MNDYIVDTSSNELSFPNWEDKLRQIKDLEARNLYTVIDTDCPHQPEAYGPTELEHIKAKYALYCGLQQEDKDVVDSNLYNILGYNNDKLYEAILKRYESKMLNLEDRSTEEDLTAAPQVAPYYSPDEIIELELGKPNEVTESLKFDAPGIIESYLSEGKLRSQYEYCQVLEALEIMKEFASDKKVIKEAIMNFGWNPEIPFTREASAKTCLRHILPIIPVVEAADAISDDVDTSEEELAERKKVITPIFVSLVSGSSVVSAGIKWFTDSQWSHASLALSSSLDPLYSFNVESKSKKFDSGFVEEGLDVYTKNDKHAKVKIFALFITHEQKAAIEETVKWYLKHKNDTHYDFKNILRIFTRRAMRHNDKERMVCSEFVYSLLKMANFRMKKSKAENLITPADIDELSDDARFYVMYEGEARNYNKKRVDDLCDKIIATLPKELYGLDESAMLESKQDSKIQRVFELAEMMRQ